MLVPGLEVVKCVTAYLKSFRKEDVLQERCIRMPGKTGTFITAWVPKSPRLFGWYEGSRGGWRILV